MKTKVDCLNLFKVYMNVDGASSNVKDVLNSGYIGEGDYVERFEESLKDKFENSLIACVNSCTSALTLSLHMAGVGHGDYVISTPMTCLATNMPILSLGANIMWADVYPTTGLINPESVEECIKVCPKHPKAIMCVDYGGAPCDYDALNDICTKYNITLISDAAHSPLGVYKDKIVGTLADYTCFSFQAIKFLTCGDGGAIAFNSVDNYNRAKLLRWFNLDRKNVSFRCVQDVSEYGFKYHMNNISAAIGLSNVVDLSSIVEKHRHNAMIYDFSLESCNLDLVKYSTDIDSSYWLYIVLVDDSDKFIKHMDDSGIKCSKVHARNDDKALFKYSHRHLPGVDYFYSKQVAIPVGWWLSKDDINYVINCIRRY